MNAKCRLLCLRELFIKYTDINHYISMERIQNYLRQHRTIAKRAKI